MHILDCTLRDGGYYTNWEYDDRCVNKFIDAIDMSNVSIIELGYKSTRKDVGRFGRCDEDFIYSILPPNTDAKLAFMVDIKEFIGDRFHDLYPIIHPPMYSPFSVVRLATHYTTIRYITDFVSFFRDMGYLISVNLMGGYLLGKIGRWKVYEIVNDCNPDIFCFADSFGQMDSFETKQILGEMRHNLSRKIKLGIHLHNNKRLAYSNALSAESWGVDYIDSSIMGMGRGAGNVPTEYLLKDTEYITDTIDDFIMPLHKMHQWGSNLAYKYCAQKNIHPLYAQVLCTRWPSIRIVLEILEKIPEEKRLKYDKEVLR